ncbi:MAG TPA: protein tyrosine phosphatase [Chryseosolibacter sp.]|nr:protein tyrosine phosphatase [Chryseosolibacter sp.]
MNLLFVCSRNKWRSLTAETIFKNHQHHDVRSAGTAADARVKVNEKLIKWADVIFVMEKRHKHLLQEKFNQSLMGKEMIVLDIADDYPYMDEELIDILKTSVGPYL